MFFSIGEARPYTWGLKRVEKGNLSKFDLSNLSKLTPQLEIRIKMLVSKKIWKRKVRSFYLSHTRCRNCLLLWILNFWGERLINHLISFPHINSHASATYLIFCNLSKSCSNIYNFSSLRDLVGYHHPPNSLWSCGCIQSYRHQFWKWNIKIHRKTLLYF